jgi:hypothetical protein
VPSGGLGAAIDFEKPEGFRYDGMVREAVRKGQWAEAMMIASTVGGKGLLEEVQRGYRESRYNQGNPMVTMMKIKSGEVSQLM